MNSSKAFLLLMGSVFALGCGLFWRDFVRRSGFPIGVSNGERIYYTATNAQGEVIRYRGGPAFGGMMGGGLACVSCHGPDGRGGPHSMHMWQMDAPDIRYRTLASEDEEHGNEAQESDQHGGEYDLETFRKAVVLGQHPNGEPLSADMPRWLIADDDLADLFEFLKTLP
ncbi:MAG: hypothetical protein Kow0088_09630 [Anaerolineales bacterium]